MASFPGQKGTGAPLPNQVIGLTATVVNAGRIDLSWTAVPGSTGYILLRNGALFSSPSGTTFSDTTVSPATTYSYAVRAVNGNGPGQPSAPASATTPPAQVTGLVATALSSSSIGTVWTATPGASTYTVDRNGNPVGTPATNAFTDTGLTASTLYTYTVAANGAGGRGAFSNPASATTQPAVGGQIKFDPSIFRITFDQNTSMQTALNLTKQIKAAYPGLRGIEKFSYPAIWENPALVGGDAQYDGSWGTGDQTQIGNLRGGRLMQRWLDECAALGITFASHDFSAWGGIPGSFPNGGSQSATNFPTGFAPAYWNSTNYGTISPATNGLWGAIWANCYTPNSVRFGYYVRYWDSRVMQLYKNRAAWYGPKFDSHPNLLQISFWDESSIPAVPGYNEPAAMGTLFGATGFFASARQSFPTTQLRYYLNYVSNGSDGNTNLDLYFPQLKANRWSTGGPDTCNEVLATSTSDPGGSSWGQFRSISADYRYLGYNAAIPNGGTPQPGVTNYFGQMHQSRIVEPEDLTFDNNPQPAPNQNKPVGAVPTGQRYLADGSMWHIVNQMNRLGATDATWMYQNFVGPSRNNFNPVTHPNALDFIASAALGGNVAVNGVTAGIKLLNTARPSSW